MQAYIVGVWLNSPVEGKEYIEGEIVRADNEFLSMKIKERVYSIEFNKIKIGKARLDLSLNRK